MNKHVRFIEPPHFTSFMAHRDGDGDNTTLPTMRSTLAGK
jgi:hypothetical protein